MTYPRYLAFDKKMEELPDGRSPSTTPLITSETSILVVLDWYAIYSNRIFFTLAKILK
jgi:hypothetical protein